MLSNQPKQKTQAILVSIIFILSITLVGFAAFFFGGQQKMIATPPNALPETPTPQNQEVMEPKNENLSQVLSLYESPHLENFTFKYDSKIWEITTIPKGSETQLILEDLKGGKLIFQYDLAYGRGGAVSTFKQGELTAINPSNTLYRLQSSVNGKTIYQYGGSDAIIDLQINQAEKEQVLKTCQDMEDGVEGMFVFSVEQCAQIKSGVIIGYIGEPTFSRSFKFKYDVPLSTINTEWGSDAYVKSIDDGTIILITSYQGSMIGEADQVVSQLKPL